MNKQELKFPTRNSPRLQIFVAKIREITQIMRNPNSRAVPIAHCSMPSSESNSRPRSPATDSSPPLPRASASARISDSSFPVAHCLGCPSSEDLFVPFSTAPAAGEHRSRAPDKTAARSAGRQKRRASCVPAIAARKDRSEAQATQRKDRKCGRWEGGIGFEPCRIAGWIMQFLYWMLLFQINPSNHAIFHRTL